MEKLIFAKISVTDKLSPTDPLPARLFGFRTRWSVEAFQWNMTNTLNRMYGYHGVQVEMLNLSQAEILNLDKNFPQFKIYSSIDEVIKSLCAPETTNQKTYIFTYRIQGSGSSQEEALDNALSAFEMDPGEPDLVEILLE